MAFGAIDMTTEVRSYPREVSLEGTRVNLREMASGDRDVALAFARSLPVHDLLFLRRDITQQEYSRRERRQSAGLRDGRSWRALVVASCGGVTCACFSRYAWQRSRTAADAGGVRDSARARYREDNRADDRRSKERRRRL